MSAKCINVNVITQTWLHENKCVYMSVGQEVTSHHILITARVLLQAML